MINLILFELSKIFRKWRTYIGFIAIGLLVPVVIIALSIEGQNFMNFALKNIKDSFMFVGNLINGYLISYFILQTLAIHIPFLIVLVGGDVLAGEATVGTYRMLLIRPVSRFQVLASKFIAGLVYTNLLILFMAVLSLGLGSMVFGTGELIVLKSKVYIFASDDVFWRFILAYGYATLSMTTVFALSFFFSSLVENAIGPIVATMAVIIVFLILSSINIDFFKSLRPYMFTYHMNNWRLFFSDPVDYSKVFNSVLVLGGHIVGLYGITHYLFVKRDILS